MNAIVALFENVIAYFQSMHWYIPFYWLLLLGYPLMYLGAWLFTQGLLALRRKDEPIEHSVHTGWGMAFLGHFIAFIFFAPDKVYPTWYAGGFHGVSTGMEILAACLRLVPYLGMGLFDLFFGVKLLTSGLMKLGSPDLTVRKT